MGKSNNPKFNEALAAELMAAVNKCLERVEEIDLGRTRHSDVPDIVPQGERAVDAKKLSSFHTVLHFLTCALFGIDGDGDRSVRHTLTDLSRFEDCEPPFQIPRTGFRASEERLWIALEASQGNLACYTETFSRHLRSYRFEREARLFHQRVRARAKNCTRCKKQGVVRVGYEEGEAWQKVHRELLEGQHLSTGSILCPECHDPEKVKAAIKKRRKALYDPPENAEDE